MIKSSVFTLDDFSGGLNTKAGTMQLQPNESPNCLNMHSNLFKSLETRKGSVELAATAVTELTGRGLYTYPFWSSNVLVTQLISFFEDKMYKMDSLDGNQDAIAFATAQSNALFSTTVFSTSTQNYLIITNVDMDRFQQYDGTTSVVTNLDASVITASKYIIAWRQHLWCAYTKETGTEHPYRLRRTDVGTRGLSATDWTAGVAGFDDVYTQDGDFVTGMATLRGFLYLFKRNSIFRVSYLGGSPLVEIRQISSIGTEAFQTIQNITLLNGDEILAFLGSDNRIYIFNGYNAPQPISELISEDNGRSQYSLKNVNWQYIESANAVNYGSRHWYVIFLPFSTSTTNNGGYIVDYYTQPFSIFPFDGWRSSGSTIATDSNGNRNLYFQTYGGKILQADKGDSDVGSSINAYYHTARLKVDKAPAMKKTQQAQLLTKAIGDYDYTFGYRNNWDSSFVYKDINQAGSGFILGTSLLGTGVLGGSDSKSVVIDVPRLFNFIQLLIKDDSTNPRLNLYQIDLLADAEGIGRV